MNKRIEELAVMIFDVEFDGHNLELFSADSYGIEKFVQLIVQECIEQCRLVQSQILVGMNTDFSVGKDMGMEVCIDAIKDHFMEEL